MHTAFCFNLDGTLTTAEVLPCIASEFGVSEEIATLTHAAMNGHLELETSLKLLYLILGKVPTEKVHEIVSNIPLDKAVLSFIGTHKTDSFIVTGKLDKWMEPISRKCGCQIYSSESIVEEGGLKLKKLLNKSGAVSDLRERGYNRIVAIGNNALDVSMLIEADIAIAFSGVLSPSSLALSVSDYVIHEGAALCKLLQAL